MSASIQLSPVIAGAMKWGIWGSAFNTQEYLSILEKCVELGVTTIDHADIYGHYTTEAEFGAALKRVPHLREKIQLITKCGIRMITPNRPSHEIKSYDASKKHIITSAEQSLKNLQTDYIDLLLIHRPDPLLHPDEVAEAFSQLRNSGKVLHFGVSNFTPSQFTMMHSRFPLATNQIEASILHREPFIDGTLDICLEKNIIPTAWSPLGGGLLFSENPDDETKRIKEAAISLQEKYQLSLDELLIAWLCQHPSGIVPVLGTSKVERIQGALKASKVIMDREDWFKLWQASLGQEVA
ncbi:MULTISPECIES: aldo/keto reductase [unclassified Paraflavitalea]|uniref:aldo/keto reductase n=1 Tax=unclassified Paraflavitalea TaxID=2798305 RepID=UPI003D34321E